MEIRPTKTFEDLLKDEFLKRQQLNKNYSLRAYARDLNIQASPLSSILRGKRPITNSMKQRLGLALGLSLQDISTMKTNREKAKMQHHLEYQDIDLETFEVLSRWYYFAILELFELNDFKYDFHWMGKKLGLSKFIIEDAIARLKRLDFLIENEQGETLINPEYRFTSSLKPLLSSEALRRFQKELLEKSAESIDNIDITERDHSSMTFSINKNDLDQAKEITKKYRRDMAKLFDANKTKDSVYQLQVSLFPVTSRTEQL